MDLSIILNTVIVKNLIFSNISMVNLAAKISIPYSPEAYQNANPGQEHKYSRDGNRNDEPKLYVCHLSSHVSFLKA